MKRRRQIPRLGRLLAALSVCVLAGCRSTPTDDAPTPATREPPPAYTVIAERYNERTRYLDRLSAGCGLRIQYTNADGKEQEDQVEGNLQIIQPDRVALRIDKVGKSYFYLGSDGERYWWLDLEQQEGLVGTHDLATLETVADFGLPVHPLDLLEILGIVPLPASLPPGQAPTWASDGRGIELNIPARWGSRILRLDPETFLPYQIELTDAAGNLAVRSELDRYESVPIFGDALHRPMAATQVWVDLPLQDVRARMRLEGLENSGARAKLKPFDLDALKSAYRIRQMHDLDEPRAGAAAK